MPQASASAVAPTPSVRAEHPRLLVTADDLLRLQQQVAAYPDEWKRIQSGGLSAPEDASLGDARTLTNTALVYVITRDDRYLKNAVALSENISRHHKFDSFLTPETVFGLALAYDWCYSGLTQPQRDEIQQAMLRTADYCRDKVWRHADTSNLFVLDKVWPFLYTGLALYGDSTDPRVDEYLRTGSDLLHSNLLPAANIMAGDTGGQFEGYGYDGWAYMRPMAQTFEAWRTATGEDLFQLCTATKYNARWNTYGVRPFDGKLEHFDDAHLGESWGASTNGAYIYLLALRYRDGRAQWMGDQIERRDTDYLWPIILWRDPSLAPRSPHDLPTASLFEPLGWVLMRSSWQPDATFASFQSGPIYAAHQHTDNNAFTIHKRSLLAIDSGVNAYGEDVSTDYRTNYYSRTIAHNSITVYDPKETFRGGAWAGEASGGANDGGQMRLRGPERIAELKQSDATLRSSEATSLRSTSRWNVGAIAAYSHDDLYTYAVGDATKSYSPAKLRLFRRHFLFLPPDVFVIFDQVDATDPSFRKAWLLHCVGEPTVSGSIATITNGPGRLTVRTVLPQNPIVTKIGGPGKECWVDGRNWPAVEQEWRPDAGSWHIEISSSRPGEEDFFLHLLQVDGDDIARPDAVSLMEVGAQHAVPAMHAYRRFTRRPCGGLQPAIPYALRPGAPALIYHRHEVRNWHVVRDRVPRPKRPAPTRKALVYAPPSVRPHVFLASPRQHIHVHSPQQPDPIPPLPLRLPHRHDDILERVLRVDPHVIDQLVHDVIELAAGVQEHRLAIPVRNLGHPLLRREDVFPQGSRARQRRVLEPHIVVDPLRPHPVHTARRLDHPAQRLIEPLRDRRHQLRAVDECVAERLEPHQERHVLQRPAWDACRHLHALRQIASHRLQPLERGRRHLRPRVLLELLPVRNRPLRLIHPRPLAARQRRRVRRPQFTVREAQVHSLGNVVVADLPPELRQPRRHRLPTVPGWRTLNRLHDAPVDPELGQPHVL